MCLRLGVGARATGVPKKILALPPLSYCAIPRGREFFLHKLFGEERFWRTWVASGREELLGSAFHRATWIEDVSEDGEELLWIKVSAPSRLVMVENVFE